VRAELLAHAPQGVEPGKPVWVGLQLKHQPQWHTYWKNPGDSGLPTQLAWTLPAGVDRRRDRLAGAEEDPDRQPGQLRLRGHRAAAGAADGHAAVQAFAAGSDLEVKLQGQLAGVPKECIPEEGDFALKLPVRSTTATATVRPSTALAATPKALARRRDPPPAGAAAATMLALTGRACRWRCAARRWSSSPKPARSSSPRREMDAGLERRRMDGLGAAVAQRSASPVVLPAGAGRRRQGPTA
jgi:hypothetical protein